MDKIEFLENIKSQIDDVDPALITMDGLFRELATYDSLTGMAIMAKIEDEYNVNIPVAEYLKLNTIAELYEFVQLKLVAK